MAAQPRPRVSHVRAYAPPQFPIFEKTGSIQWKATQTATAKAKDENTQNYLCTATAQARAETSAAVLYTNHNSRMCHLSCHVMQYGKYEGQSFQWLLSNDIGYTTGILADHCQEKQLWAKTVDPGEPMPEPKPDSIAACGWDNKEKLLEFTNLFPAIRRMTEEKTSFNKRMKKTRERFAKNHKALMQKIIQHEAAAASSAPVTAPPPPKPTATQQTAAVGDGTEDLMSDADDALLASFIKSPEKLPPPRPPLPSTSSTSSANVPPETGNIAPTPPPKKATKKDKGDLALPPNWIDTLPDSMVSWVSQLFRQGQHHVELKSTAGDMWHYPPQPRLRPHLLPKLDLFFAEPLFLWAPKRHAGYFLRCKRCSRFGNSLASAGFVGTVRRVVDVNRFYYMGAEYLSCKACKKKTAAWDRDILDQLDIGYRSKFPAILTYRLACDVKVVTLLRDRGLGNSPSRLMRSITENHHQLYLQRCVQYLTACRNIKGEIPSPPDMPNLPKYGWLQTVYCQDVESREPEIKAQITNVYGEYLKMDSTKKIAKKLAGDSKDTASWATNVGNEDGSVLITVVTTHEGSGLMDMIRGLITRYEKSGHAHPKVFYVDRDCCSSTEINNLLKEHWKNLEIRLDIWHFMRRFSIGVTHDSHILYPEFMRQLSTCIFQYDQGDLERLVQAKQEQLNHEQERDDVSEDDAFSSLTRTELNNHCRRATRGVEETTRLIDELITTFKGPHGYDTMGNPLIHPERMDREWNAQKKHVKCIQDPKGAHIKLYNTKPKTLKKFKHAKIDLPVYTCGRGSTSLENYHLHLARFIPGTTASDKHFQMYLLDGLARWNQDRSRTAQGTAHHPTSYQYKLESYANKLSQRYCGIDLAPAHVKTRQYTGELIGMEYLYSQTTGGIQELRKNDLAKRAQKEPEAEEGIAESGFTPESDDYTVPMPDLRQLHPKRPTRRSNSSIPDPVTPDSIADPATPGTSGQVEILSRRTPRPKSHTSSISLSVEAVEDGEGSSSQGGSSSDSDVEHSDQVDTKSPRKSQCPDKSHLPGFDRVVNLAIWLASMRDRTQPWEDNEADYCIQLYNNLEPGDRLPPKPRKQLYKTDRGGRFKSGDLRSMDPSQQRSAVGLHGKKASRPDASRIMAQLCVQLLPHYRAAHKFTRVAEAYNRISNLVEQSPKVCEETKLVLLYVNHASVRLWSDSRDKQFLKRQLARTIPDESARNLTTQCPPARQHRISPPVPVDDTHDYDAPVPMDGTDHSRRKPVPDLLIPDIRVKEPVPPIVPIDLTGADPTLPAYIVNVRPGEIVVRPTDTVKEEIEIEYEPMPSSRPAYSQLGTSRESKYRRKRLEAEIAQGIPHKIYDRHVSHYTCGRCQGPKTKENGHQRWQFYHYCPRFHAPLSFAEYEACSKVDYKAYQQAKKQKLVGKLSEWFELVKQGRAPNHFLPPERPPTAAGDAPFDNEPPPPPVIVSDSPPVAAKKRKLTKKAPSAFTAPRSTATATTRPILPVTITPRPLRPRLPPGPPATPPRFITPVPYVDLTTPQRRFVTIRVPIESLTTCQPPTRTTQTAPSAAQGVPPWRR